MKTVGEVPKNRWKIAWRRSVETVEQGSMVDDDAARSVKIFFWALAFAGVNLREDKKDGRVTCSLLKTIISAVVLLVQSTLCVLLAWFTCYTLFLSTEPFVRDRGYEILYLFIFTFFNTISAIIHLVRRRKIIGLIGHLRAYLAKTNRATSSTDPQVEKILWETERRWTTGALICACISLALQFTKNSVTLMVIKQGKGVATLPYARFLICVSYVHVAFTHSFYTLSIGLFVMVCRLLRLAFSTCHLPDTGHATCTERDRLLAMQKRHQQACALVKEADNVFSPIVFTWFASHILCSCCMLRAFKAILFPTRPFSYQFIFDAIYYLCSTLLCFVVISLSAANANEQVTKSLEPLGRISCADESSSPSSLVNQIRTTNYIVNVTAHPAGISGMGFFTVTRGLILAVSTLNLRYFSDHFMVNISCRFNSQIGGTIVTYTLVLYNL